MSLPRALPIVHCLEVTCVSICQSVQNRTPSFVVEGSHAFHHFPTRHANALQKADWWLIWTCWVNPSAISQWSLLFRFVHLTCFLIHLKIFLSLYIYKTHIFCQKTHRFCQLLLWDFTWLSWLYMIVQVGLIRSQFHHVSLWFTALTSCHVGHRTAAPGRQRIASEACGSGWFRYLCKLLHNTAHRRIVSGEVTRQRCS